jgi:hypothetical protein
MFAYPLPRSLRSMRSISPDELEDDPRRPDAERAFIAVNNLQRAARLVKSPEGGAALGLGEGAAASLALLRERLPHHEGIAADTGIAGRSMLLVSTAGLFEDLLDATYLPNRDATIASRLAGIRVRAAKNGWSEAERKTEVDALSEALHHVIISVSTNQIGLRSQIPGIEAEASIPAVGDGPGLTRRGSAFRVRHHILHDLFLRRSTVVGSRIPSRDCLVFWRYDPVAPLLELFVGSARISFEVHPECVPDVTLDSLASQARRRPLAAAHFAEVIARTRRLGRLTENVTQYDGRIVGTSLQAMVAVRADTLDREVLAVPHGLSSIMGNVFRHLRAGATIRTDGNHNYVEKGALTVVFPTATPVVTSPDEMLETVRRAGIKARFSREDIFKGVMLGRTMTGNMTAAEKDASFRARLELRAGPTPVVVQVCTLVTSKVQGTCTTSVEAAYAESNGLHDSVAFEIDDTRWLWLLGRARGKFVDLIVDAGNKTVVFSDGDDEGIFLTFLHVHFVEPFHDSVGLGPASTPQIPVPAPAVISTAVRD